MEMAEIVMNPVRQRIFQYFLLHETGTVKEVKKALPDVPNASLYRHIKILTDSSILIIVDENRIRGTVESVYQLNKEALEKEDESEFFRNMDEEDKKNITLLFRGSENQRLIDVKKSLEEGQVVEWKPAIKRGL